MAESLPLGPPQPRQGELPSSPAQQRKSRQCPGGVAAGVGWREGRLG